MEGVSVWDCISIALLLALAVSALQLCVRSVRFRVSRGIPNANAAERSDIEASLLAHVGGSDEELSIAVHPRRTALRILYPVEIALAGSMAALSLAEQVVPLVWGTPGALDASRSVGSLGTVETLGAVGEASARAFEAASVARALLVLGWGAQVAALVKARASLAVDPTSRALRGEIRAWSLVALLYYVVMAAVYDTGRVGPHVTGIAMSMAGVLIEMCIEYGGSAPEEQVDPGRRREKGWILLLGAAITYVWPDSFHLRVRAVLCMLLVFCVRVLNIAVPYSYKKVIDSFSSVDDDGGPVPFGTLAYPWVALYLGCSLLQGGTGGGTVGLLQNLRQFLWIPISQEAYKRLSLDIFGHVLSLDHDFHLHRKTGELLRIMDRGTVSVQTLLGTIMFQIGPAMFDIAAAATFLAIRMQLWIAFIVFLSLGIYMPMTIYVTEYRGKYRRELNKLDNARSARATDALLNYETIKIFGNETLETSNYKTAIANYQQVDFKLIASMNMLNVLQSLVIFSGVASGLLLCTYGVSRGTLSVGDTVLFVSMMQQLYAPLNFFGTYYRMLQTAALDMEGVFRLLETEASIRDRQGAVDFADDGKELDIVFSNVRFRYTEQGNEALKGISFTAGGGKTTSLVGSTGSGKSTILRLLVRFYDPTGGLITIGRQPLDGITLASLRKVISVVPQDTVLLNDTIWYNIKYGNPDASDEEVVEAAKGACLYDTIMNRFPDGFSTLVGERGLRLSGGEKQRVAFARAILRNPPVLVLDEATSALDSLTEDSLWQTLARKKQNRTVVIVAHRLSTVVDSDKIIVVKHGEIAEEGTHDELLMNDQGLYRQMWAKQSQSGGQSSIEELLMGE
jgi:ATP-binding cassette subfamily B (MDR/TAP) protein 6